MKTRRIVLGLVLVAIVAAIFYLQSTTPKIASAPTDADIKVESLHGGLNASGNASASPLSKTDRERIAMKAAKYERAKELVSPEGYINVDNITIADHIGKDVILVDFWTYSCINCQRTLPYLTSWYGKYKDQGLLIIGVHTPEFEFEKDYDNVLAAVRKWNITYPVVLDNDRQTWQAYNNHYWPHKYLIDIDGFIVDDHIGEGGYAQTEQKIQELLKERQEVLHLTGETIASGTVSFSEDKGSGSGRTPEIYFGYGYARGQLGNGQGWQPDMVVDYTPPDTLAQHHFYLEGRWKNNADNMELVDATGTIILDYTAKSVNIVAGAEQPVTIGVYLDGEKVKDVTVQAHDLYSLISSDASGEHVLELRAGKGLQAYTFTFG